MRRLRELENALLRAESAVAVVLVLLMLVLAAYNVVYRNVLVPLQNHWAHSGPPVEPAAPAPAAPAPETKAATPSPEAKAETKPESGGGDDFGGFGGGLEPSEAEDKAEPGGGDDFGGFGGGLGDEAEPDKAEPAEAKVDDAKAEPAGGDDFGGFGGGFSGEAEKAEPETKAEAPKPEAKQPEPPESGGGDDFGGFGGGFGDEAKEAEPEAKKAEAPSKASDDFGGFGGGFDDETKEAEPEAKKAGGDFGGFGGGLGDDGGDDGDGDAEAGAGAEGFGGGLGAGESGAPDDEDGEDDFFGDDDLGDDDQFANLPEIDAVGQKDKSADEGPVGGPPPEGSFAAWGVQFIDDIKLDWIDVFLRQLVIIVAFLGAMLATVRRKHINIDALSKVLPKKAQRVVSVIIPAFAVFICVMLARAGWDLVQISREFPKELLPFADEWHMQLMFPVGFGLLAVHFSVRLLEAFVGPPAVEEAPDPKPSAIVTLVDEEYDPDPEILGSVRKKIAQIEMSGELSMPPRDEDEAGDDDAGETDGDDEAGDQTDGEDDADADEEGGR